MLVSTARHNHEKAVGQRAMLQQLQPKNAIGNSQTPTAIRDYAFLLRVTVKFT